MTNLLTIKETAFAIACALVTHGALLALALGQ